MKKEESNNALAATKIFQKYSKKHVKSLICKLLTCRNYFILKIFLINGDLIVNEKLERDATLLKILTELLQVLLQHLAAAVFVEELHHDGTCMFRDA